MTIGCKRCGRCCLAAELWLDPTMDEKNATFAMKRTGAHLIWRDFQGHLKVLLGPCPHLSLDKATCLIYDERPEVCKEMASTPGSCVPGCRFYDDSWVEGDRK